MTDRFITPVFTAVDANGETVAGAPLFFYVTGTTTAKNTFSDAALTTVNPNPVIADFTGRFGDIFLESGDYKVVLKDADDAVVWTRDPVAGMSTSVSSLTDADGDTKIQLEETADDDTIRFDALGTEIATIDSAGIKPAVGFGITDADGATKIQLEETTDDDTIRFDALGTEIMTIDSGGVDILNPKTLGVGSAHDLGVGIHVKTGDSGGSTSASHDELVIENSSDAGIQILSGASDTGQIAFGDSGSAQAGRIVYDHSNTWMQLIVEDSSAVIIDANKTLFINDTANANMTTGITINQGNNQNEILTFKSSDVAAGTVVSEPDTNAYLSKITITGGGLNQVAISDAQISTNPTLRLQGWAGSNASTSKTTSAVGIVTAFATQHDGAGSQSDIVANGNAFVVQGRSGGANNGLFIVDEDGDLFADGSTSSTNMVTKFDDFHDAALVEDFNEYLGAGEKPDFERLRRMARLDLVGAVTEEEWNTGVRPLWNVTRTVQLHNGAHAQAWVREQVRDTILAQLIPGYRQAMEMLATGRNIGSLPEMIAA